MKQDIEAKDTTRPPFIEGRKTAPVLVATLTQDDASLIMNREAGVDTESAQSASDSQDPNTAARGRGRPARDYTAEVGEIYGFLHIDALEGRDKRYRALVRTTCLWRGCGIVSTKRLDKLKDGTTVSCNCLKHEIYMGWRRDALAKMLPGRKKQIWADAQILSRPKLLKKYHGMYAITVYLVIHEEQRRINEEKRQFDLEEDYRIQLRRLHTEVLDTGFEKGQRMKPLFNSHELTFMKDGAITGAILPVYLWAQRRRDVADSETSKLIDWMMETVDATRIHRLELRAHFTRKAEEKKSA